MFALHVRLHEDYTIHKQDRKNKNDQQLFALHVMLKPEWAAGTE